MHPVWKVLIAVFGAVSVATVGACTRPTTPAAGSSTTPWNGSAPVALQSLLTADLLGEEVPYFERQAGPAMRVDETWRTYRIGGCTMDLQPAGTKIIGVRLTLDPKCDVDVSALIADEFKFPPLHTLTFGSLQKTIGYGVMHAADCLRNCGNREPTDIYAFYEGPHADDALQIVASAQTYGPPNEEIVSGWAKALLKARGEDWMNARDYNCGNEPLTMPATLKSVKVATLTIGRQMKLPGDGSCTAEAKTDESTSIRSAAHTADEVLTDDPNDQGWYFMASKLSRCVAVSVVPGQYTPDDVIASFARDGKPQVVIQRKVDQVLIRSAADADDPGMTILRGKTHCEVTLAMLKSRHLID